MSEPMTDYHTSFVSLEKMDAPHSPGHKADANKVRPRLVMEGFPLALTAVAEVATFGANKYCEGGWAHVPNGIHRYSDALYRHLLKAATGELRDPESGLLHHAHAAWNALAILQLLLTDYDNPLPVPAPAAHHRYPPLSE